ncbi:MAG: DUF814 domain-containing protein [Candidatus Micrarchaeota archaeon]|nr:DUF814 domain-containing protein [Candidatus Micrarchaeota archaeon]
MTDVEIDLTISAQDNANEYFYKSKRAKRKKEGAQEIIGEMEEKLEKAKKKFEATKETKKVKLVGKREWYEKFHWFFASNGMLVIGGRDAAQNELINSKHFDEGDLFFHADIHGASVTILKGGVGADRETKEEVAQFAGCYSSAWKEGLNTIDVYALERKQITKSKSQGSLGTGSFAMSGEREWFKSMKLELVAFVSTRKVDEEELTYLSVVPESCFRKLKVQKAVRITLGSMKKSDAAKMIGKKLAYEDIDYIMQQLPAGEFTIK